MRVASRVAQLVVMLAGMKASELVGMSAQQRVVVMEGRWVGYLVEWLVVEWADGSVEY